MEFSYQGLLHTSTLFQVLGIICMLEFIGGLWYCWLTDPSTTHPITVLEPSPFCLCRFLGPATKQGVGQCFHQPVRLFAYEEPPVFGVLVSNMDGYNYPSSYRALGSLPTLTGARAVHQDPRHLYRAHRVLSRRARLHTVPSRSREDLQQASSSQSVHRDGLIT